MHHAMYVTRCNSRKILHRIVNSLRDGKVPWVVGGFILFLSLSPMRSSSQSFYTQQEHGSFLIQSVVSVSQTCVLTRFAASAFAHRDGDGDGGAADGAGGRPGEPRVDAGGVERVRAGRHRAPPLPGARGLEAHGARARARGGGAGGLIVTVAVGARGGGGGEGEARKAVDVGGREPRAERLRRRRRGGRVERRDAVAAAAAVAGCARGEDEDEEEQGGRGGEEEEDRERERLHGEREEARARALALAGPVLVGFSSRSRGELAGWSGRGHSGEAGRSASLAGVAGSGVPRCGVWSVDSNIQTGIGRALALALLSPAGRPAFEPFARVRYVGGCVCRLP
jgi:hypothetical protein|uniref:Uncharacterized protein n=1 Tax=Zea mays TaxID=4577 RepID=A0A804P3T9_MAIZE